MSFLALSRMTVADQVRQPLTWLTAVAGGALLGLSYTFGLFNFETEDRLRMLSTAGVAVGIVVGLFLAVVGMSQAIHDELASRTALTLFAKPLGRGQYLVGKTLGILVSVWTIQVVLALAHAGLLFAGAITGFEGGGAVADGQLSVPWAAVVAAHVLGLAHTLVLAAIAAVLALRLPLVANIITCFGVFVGAHLLGSLGWQGAVLIPALGAFNLDDALQLPRVDVPWDVVGLALLYSLLAAAGWLSVGTALFNRQDIP
jgi:hypothetical protein